MAPPSTKSIIAHEDDQRGHEISSMVQKHKDLVNSVLSILFQDSNNADLTETDLVCNTQLLAEEYYRALKFSKFKFSGFFQKEIKWSQYWDL